MADCIGCGSMHHDHAACTKCGGALCSSCYSSYAIDGVCNDCRYKRQAIGDLKQELKQLQAFIEHVPKINEFNEDKTAVTQTCPVWPGMRVWAVGESIHKAKVIATATENALIQFEDELLRNIWVMYNQLFNTPEAAEAGR